MKAWIPTLHKHSSGKLVLIVTLFALIVVCASTAGATRAVGTPSAQENKPAATVKVEVRETQDKKGVEVKVRAEGDKVDNSEQPKILPSPEEKLAPVETKAIDKAAERVSKKIEEITDKASSRVGAWIDAETLYGITWLKLCTSIALVLVVILFARILNAVIDAWLRSASQRGVGQTWREVLLEAISKPLTLFIWVYGIYGALSLLFPHFDRPDGTNIVNKVAASTADVAGTVAVIWFAYRVVSLVDIQVRKWAPSTDSKVDDVLVSLVGRTLRVLTILLGGIILVQNLTGIEIGPLLASLGLGGLAVALAAKDSIANFFGTVTIIFDKPFQVGEHIVFDKYRGIVEAIGFRSTRIRTFEGHLVSIPNEKVINSGVENIGRRPHIRWHTNLTITYDTTPDKVEKAVGIIKEALDNHEGMHPDFPPRVFFNGFNDWSLNIAIYAWYHPGDWWDYQAWLQEMCLRIMRGFEQEGIEFAFPTSTLYLANDEKRQLKVEMLQGHLPRGGEDQAQQSVSSRTGD